MMAPHGGIFVFPVVGNPVAYLIALVVGTVISAGLLGILKKKVDETKRLAYNRGNISWEEVAMLTEQRYEKILALLEEKKSITVSELTELLGISESTARRDITALSKAGRLKKVFGGAVLNDNSHVMQEPTVAEKKELHRKEKVLIARQAASIIDDSDFVYIDAGTTTGCMLEFMTETKAVFVTNAVDNARKLAA